MLLSNFGAFTGMYRQMIAIMEPVIAIHTTEMADGTRASNDPKWSFASRKPKADDFMEVSMAIVRDDTSENPIHLGSYSASSTTVVTTLIKAEGGGGAALVF